MKGYIIKNLRKEKRLTQKKLAETLNISRSTISMIEINKSNGSKKVLNKLSIFFGVSLSYLECNELRYSNKIHNIEIDLLEYLVDINTVDDINNLLRI